MWSQFLLSQEVTLIFWLLPLTRLGSNVDILKDIKIILMAFTIVGTFHNLHALISVLRKHQMLGLLSAFSIILRLIVPILETMQPSNLSVFATRPTKLCQMLFRSVLGFSTNLLQIYHILGPSLFPSSS